MNIIIFLITLLINTSLFSAEASPSNILIRGIVLTGGQQENLENEGWEPDCAQCCNLELPDNASSLISSLEKTYLGAPLNRDTLLEIKEVIISYYRSCHRPFVIVEIPPQNITQGIIQFTVTETRICNINAHGCSWFNDDKLASRLGIAPGQAITANALLTEVAWLNQNPFHRSNISFAPGTEPGTTSVELVTQDRFPVRPYAGIDNTGNRATGFSRYYAGLTWGNVFGFDHQFTYQATFDSTFKRFIGQTVNYVAPLPWKNTLYFFGGFAIVQPDIKRFLRSTGHSSQASIRYEIPIGKIYESTYQNIRFGFDYKNTNNNLVYLSENEIPLIVHNINLSQFMLGYDSGFYVCDNLLEADISLFISPGEMLPHESKKDYAMLTPGATARYTYCRATLGYVYPFCNCATLGLVARGQYSNQALLPSEQFGLGGYDTVRGYNEREINVENAACFNIEVRSKPISVINRTFCGKPVCDELIALAFMDFGTGYNLGKDPRHRNPHHKHRWKNKNYTLWSIGPGLRYNFQNYLSARMDLGFKLIRTPFDKNYGMHLHFGVIASY